MKENFYIIIETMHYGDNGVSENVSAFLFVDLICEIGCLSCN